MTPPHLDPLAPVPVWFVKLSVRWCAATGRYVPPYYRSSYWAGARLARKRGWL